MEKDKKNKGKISIGLDIGTNSVGWSVVDEDNQLIKKNGKTLWGVRMFEEAADASARRVFRGSRIRLKRRKDRMMLLRSIFASEISKVDPSFYERLDDSFYLIEDKRHKNIHNLFVNEFTDKEFFGLFPTIYHLRDFLIKSNEKANIKYIYLAIANMIKFRGNFLTPGDEFNSNDDTSIRQIFNLYNEMSVELGIELEDYADYFQQIEITDSIFKNLKTIMVSSKTKNDKKRQLKELFKADAKSLTNEYLIPLLVGGSTNISKLQPVKDNGYEKCDVTVVTDDLDGLINEKKGTVNELSKLLDFLPSIKDIFDFYYVSKLLNSSATLSEAMIKKYDDHKNDLASLKRLIRRYIPEKYNECFRTLDKGGKLSNYPSYIGMNNVNGKPLRTGHAKREDFYAYIKKLLLQINAPEEKKLIDKMLLKMENNEFLLRQNSDQNGAIPMQLNLSEITTILNKQKKFYPFLEEVDSTGLSNIEKIKEIFKYKVPYYVGHLSQANDNSWVVRSKEHIYPWNFEKVINIDETAKAFIERMQRKCTYLKGEHDYCLPKNSIIFSEYNCLSYLNKLSINGSLIPVDVKNDIFKNVFLVKKKPTRKDIYTYIHAKYGDTDLKTSQLKDLPEINCDMSSYVKFKEIFQDKFEENILVIEEIIKDIVVFNDKKILARRLKELYKLDDEIIKKIKDLIYVGYSNLSKHFLYSMNISNPETGEVYGNVIDIMRNTNANLQQILYDPMYRLIDIVDEYNKENTISSEEQDIDDFIESNVSISPIMKRPMIQSYKIIEEVEKILDRPIDEYYIECARTNKAQKKATNTRYYNLKEYYKKCKSLCFQFNIDYELMNKLLDENKDKLRSDLFYLYFTQLGKCMYSLENIDLDDLLSNSKYDIDHIYPQSLIKDDSLSNRVLTLKSKNNAKDNSFTFEIEGFLNPGCFAFYKLLKDNGLITTEKYNRLTKKEINPAELEGFVNRQIVATNQAVIGLIDILKYYKNINQKNIIYSKAENITSARKLFDIPKSRTANNFHHAHDAYLNVVIGRTLNRYYTLHSFNGYKDISRLKVEGVTINPEKILSYNRKFKDQIIWDKDKTISLIKKNIFERYDVMETVRTHNPNTMLSKVTILPAASSNNLVPLKSAGPMSNIQKYGGYTSHSFSKYVVVKSVKKNVDVYELEAIPKMFENDMDAYLKAIGYKDYEICLDNVKTNVVVKVDKLKYCITGRTGDRFTIKNLTDRYFNNPMIKIIKKIEKYNFNIINKISMQTTEDKVIVSPEGRKGHAIIIGKQEVIELINELVKKYSNPCFKYSPIETVVSAVKQVELSEKNISLLIYLASQLLLLLKTNERKTADLVEIGLSKNTASLSRTKELAPGTEFIAESVTGYYSKVLFKVPR